MTCGQCRRAVDELRGEIFITPTGTEFRIESACADCIDVLRRFVEQFLLAAKS